MSIISIKCPNCGAPIQGKEESCRYCQAMVVFTPDYKEIRLVGFPCPKCKTPNDKGIRFCSKCGAPLQIKCSSCRHDMPNDAAICPHCRASRVVKSLIADADERKRQVDQETAAALAEVDQAVQQNEIFKKVAGRLKADAATLMSEATAILAKKSKTQLFAILLFIGVLVAPLLCCLLSSFLMALLQPKGQAASGTAFGVMCLPWVLVIVFLVAGIIFQIKVRSISKKAVALQQKAEEMTVPNAWKKFANASENQSIQAVLVWGQEQKNAHLQKQKSRHAEIDKWLEESTDMLT